VAKMDVSEAFASTGRLRNLTLAVVLFSVLAGVGAAAGLFGMSEAAAALGLPGNLGFWVVTGVVLAIGMAVYLYFRRIDWI